MRLLIALLLLSCPLSAVQLLFFEEERMDEMKRIELFQQMIASEPPRCFSSLDLRKWPKIEQSWISPTLWQLIALHAFLHDKEIKTAILTYAQLHGPLEFDAAVQNLTSRDLVTSVFTIPAERIASLSSLFFKINQRAAKLYRSREGNQQEMLRELLSELPPFEEWRKRGFPFPDPRWIYNTHSPHIFYNALTDASLLSRILELEQIAHTEGKWVLYRGFAGSNYPGTLCIEGDDNHALSFGSTLLGGTFFSLEATALTYAKPHIEEGEWSFLALQVTPEEMQELFRVGPLHPFLQLFADGEMFHAHTKIARDTTTYTKPLDGYFMACNKQCRDPLDYVLTLQMTPQQLEEKFQALCKKSGTIFRAQNFRE